MKVRPGEKVGRWTAIEYVGASIWRARCDCGEIRDVKWAMVRRGNWKSCGCYKRDNPPARTHGASDSSLYRIWRDMRRRCTNPDRDDWVRYGGRGITVCERWEQSFEAFAEDMSDGYATGLQIDRIDNDGPYSPENCRWATPVENGSNKRNNRMIDTPWGHITLSEAARRAGLKRLTLRRRLEAGWSVERALTQPLRGEAPQISLT